MACLPVIVLRPEPGQSATLQAARAAGLNARGFALFEVAPVPWQAPPATRFSGLLAGSANLFLHGGPGLEDLAGLPVYAVGEATAQAARGMDFAIAQVGSGGMQPLVELLLPGHYLRLAGEAHVPLELPAGVQVTTLVCYQAQALPLPSELDILLRAPALVLLHSGEAAQHFAAECARLNIDRSKIALACLAPRIAEAAGAGWSAVELAETRSDAALLALAMQMCQRCNP